MIPHGDGIAVIKRWRPDAGRYAVLPGGGVEPGENAEDAARREAREELGVDVEIVRVLAVSPDPDDVPHTLFLARITGGAFGTGTGEEFTAERQQRRGTYEPAVVPVGELRAVGLRPEWLVDRIPEWLSSTAG